MEDWFAAVKAGDQPLVAGYSPRFKKSVNSDGMTALMVAAEMGNIELATILLKDEQRIKDRQGRTALIYAIKSGQSQLCRLLATCELDTSSLKNHSPFSMAIQSNAHECLQAMLQAVGPVKVVDNPLLTATSVGCLRCLRTLLEYGQCFDKKEFDEALARAEELGLAELCAELVSWEHEVADIIERANKALQEPAHDSMDTPTRSLAESHFINISEIKHDLNERIAHLLEENKELRTMLKSAEDDNEVLRTELADLRTQQEDQIDSDSNNGDDFNTGRTRPRPGDDKAVSTKDDLSEASLQFPVDLLDEVLPLDVTETLSPSMIQAARNLTLKSSSYLLSRRLFGEQSACDQSYSASLLTGQQGVPENGDKKGMVPGQASHRGPTYHRNTGYKRKKTHHTK